MEMEPSKNDRGITSFGVLFSRVMWLLIGPGILLFTTFGNLLRWSGWLTAIDAAYFIAVALMIWGRWVEQRSGTATTAMGEPATIAHFRRYVRALLPLSAASWVAANLLGVQLAG